MGNKKLFVNISKYRRHSFESNKAERRILRGTHTVSHKDTEKCHQKVYEVGGKQRSKEVWVEKNGKKSFVDAVKGQPQEQWKGLVIKTQQHIKPWMEKSVIGKLKEDTDFGQLGEELVRGGLNMLRVRLLGDKLVLITPEERENLDDIIKSNKGWFDDVIASIEPWSVSSGPSHKSVWVRCYGLPLPFWNRDCFAKVIGVLDLSATLVSIDNSFMSWEILEFARLQVRMLISGNTRMVKSVQINNHLCSITIEEESLACYGGRCKVNNSYFDSSDSVSSSETYVEGTDVSVNGEEEVMLGDGEECRSRVEEEGGERLDEGVQCTQRTNVLF